MKNRTSRNFSAGAIVLFIATLLVWPAIDRNPLAQENSATTEKSLTRKYDVVIVQGQFLRNFQGIPIEKLALFGLRDGKLSPIPFQIDERDSQGQFVMTSGKSAGRDDDGGKLDGNDELVFYIIDAGDRLPETQRSDKIEIDVTDPRYPDRHAWAYLAYFKAGKVPRSTVDYVNYDPSKDSIISKYYTLTYSKGFLLFNDLMVPESAGGNGEDFLDRFKVRFKVEFLGGKVTLNRTENHTSSEVLGWVDGPVRVLRSAINYLKIFDYLPSVKFRTVFENYHYYHVAPINLKFPFNLNTVINLLDISSIQLIGIVDAPGVVGGYGHFNLFPEGAPYTGHSSPADVPALNPTLGFVWGFGTKKGVGTIFVRFLFPDMIYQYNSFNLLDNESESMSNPPDDIPGEVGGRWHLDFAKLPPDLIEQVFQDSVMFKVDGYFPPPGLTSEGAKEWLDIRDYPLLVDVLAGSEVPNPPRQSKVVATPPWEGGRDGTITDVRDRKIALKKIAFFVGGIEADARSYFPGERVTDTTFHTCPLAETKSITNYYVDFDPHTKTKNAMFSKVTKTNGTTLKLLGCKACGWGGLDDEGRVVYYSNAQIKRIDFAQGN